MLEAMYDSELQVILSLSLLIATMIYLHKRNKKGIDNG
jgi:hypothetical protein